MLFDLATDRCFELQAGDFAEEHRAVRFDTGGHLKGGLRFFRFAVLQLGDTQSDVRGQQAIVQFDRIVKRLRRFEMVAIAQVQRTDLDECFEVIGIQLNGFAVLNHRPRRVTLL